MGISGQKYCLVRYPRLYWCVFRWV